MHGWVVCVAAASALGAGACAGDEHASSTTLYFLSSERSAPVAVSRPGRLSAAEALAELLEGPTPEEARRGISTAIPAHVQVRDFRIDGDNARIHFAALPRPASAVERFRIITQLTRSIIGRSGIERLWFRSDGQPWGLWRMTGGIDHGPYTSGGCTSVGSGAPGTETVIADSFASC